MSTETDYLQRFIDLKYTFENDPRFHPRATRLPWIMQIGIEITIVEANTCYAFYDSNGTFQASISPGQKSYIRGDVSEYIQAYGGIKLGGGPITFRAGLRFPSPSRWYAFDPASIQWVYDTPFRNNFVTRLTSIEVSLVPFHLGSILGGQPVERPDGRVHVLVRRRDRQIVILNDVTFNERTQQLYGYGPSMEPIDNASLWIISFYISPGIIE